MRYVTCVTSCYFSKNTEKAIRTNALSVCYLCYLKNKAIYIYSIGENIFPRSYKKQVTEVTLYISIYNYSYKYILYIGFLVILPVTSLLLFAGNKEVTQVTRANLYI